jgi:riboflavin kinase/FMN adenylyltransferase
LTSREDRQAFEELARLRPDRDTVLTVGVFDGIHLGHRQLIEQVKRRATERVLKGGVVTLHHHPQIVLSPQSSITYLTTLDERVALIRGLGIELVAVLSFTPALARLSAPEFVSLLQEHLRMKGLVIGPDFALGRGRQGDAATLRALGQERGFTVEVLPPVMVGGRVVSSTAIREALVKGDLATASRLLGRPFSLSGKVTPGDERGRQLGFPTANIAANSALTIPADGIYVTRAYVDGQPYRSVTNIGVRPTFGGGKRLIEVHLLDFSGDLYGHQLKVELVERLRGEARFNSVDELVAQIKRDVERARAVLG